MKHETTRTLHSYWNELRGRRRAPLRLEVDPASIAAILGNAFVLERTDPVSYSYRLAGTRVCGYHGRELRGTSFAEHWAADERETMVNLLYTVTEDASGAVIGFSAHAPNGRKAPFEMLLLPLARDNGLLDRVIGTVAPLSDQSWIGSVPISRLQIKSIRLVWPDGTPSLGHGQEFAPSHSPIPAAAAEQRRGLTLIEGGRR